MLLRFQRMCGWLWAVCALAVAIGLEVSGPAVAQPVPFPILEPWQTVEIEHDDRKNRLVRLSNIQGIPQTEFSEYLIAPEKHGLRDYPVQIPVLRVIFRDRVFFDFAKAQIKPEANAVINIIAESLQLEASDVTVFVAGHTDAIGSVNYNLQLGLRRSRTVSSDLVGRGVAKTQVYVVSFGKAAPIASNDTDDGRAQNRRVEFLFSARPEPIAAWLSEQPIITCATDTTPKGDNCPVDLTFRAESVDLKTQPTTIIPPEIPSIQDPHAPRVAIDPATAPKSVTFGSKVVTIDLRQKIFSFPPPEGSSR